jgi:hypothetical protein
MSESRSRNAAAEAGVGLGLARPGPRLRQASPEDRASSAAIARRCAAPPNVQGFPYLADALIP